MRIIGESILVNRNRLNSLRTRFLLNWIFREIGPLPFLFYLSLPFFQPCSFILSFCHSSFFFYFSNHFLLSFFHPLFVFLCLFLSLQHCLLAMPLNSFLARFVSLSVFSVKIKFFSFRFWWQSGKVSRQRQTQKQFSSSVDFLPWGGEEKAESQHCRNFIGVTSRGA